MIATRSGGLPEIVENGVNGFLSEIGDVESMSRNARNILSNDVLLNTFSKAARKTAERFDISNIVPQYEELYIKVLRK